jgi:molybdopterin-guanine dinucleotide biosynthesis protein A
VGGRSTRLGRDKALEPFGTSNLLERVLSRLSLFKSDIIIVAHAGQELGRVVQNKKLRVVFDIYPDRGPLGGIYTGLFTSTTPYSLLVAGDMPFLNVELLRYMIQLSPEFDLVAPRKGKYFEPLHAVYSHVCLKPIEDMLKQGELKIDKLFDRVKIRYIDSKEIDRFDPQRVSFFNINTEADLKKAKELITLKRTC